MRLAICKEAVILVYENPVSTSENLSGVSDEILYGWLFEIMEEMDDYYHIRTFYGYTGFVKKESCIVPFTFERRNHLCYLDGNFVDVLTIPDVRGRRLLTLYRGSLIAVIEYNLSDSGWAKVQLLDGRIGYLRTKYLRKRQDNDNYLLCGKSLDDVDIKAICESKFRKNIIDAALQYYGSPYRWGGKTDKGMDCSGLAFMCYQKNGVLIYRDAKMKEGFPIHKICLCNVEMGDLLYFPGHMAIYWKCGKYIHATAEKYSNGVVINSLCEKDKNFRKDLKDNLIEVGSLFSV